MTRCPLCRARLAGADNCPRCGADLGRARAAREMASQYVERALACLAAGERQRARACVEQALWLHRTPLAEAMADWLRLPAPAFAPS